MNRNTIVLVDETDNVVGHADKLKVHQEGVLHSAFSIFVFRRDRAGLELLLQQRAAGKYHCANLWSNTCCSHPGPGESLRESAMSRLHEEMGFSVPLTWLARHTYRAELDNGLVEHEVDHLFAGWYQGQRIAPDPEEVSDYRWMSIPRLRARLVRRPASHTPWLADTLEKVNRSMRGWVELSEAV